MMRAASAVPLSRFQDAFARALLAEPAEADACVAALVAQPAFAVYRNTLMKGCVDALEANFPAVARLVGEEWFRAAAAVYAGAELPSAPSLLAYGGTFPDFLVRFEPAAGMPWLPDVARLDRLWTESHAAADGPVFDRSAFARLAPESLGEAVLEPHPSARWAWFATAPVFTIWSRNRDDGAPECDIDWHGEGALLTRPLGTVQWEAIDAAACRFLDACAAGTPLAGALEAALAAEPDANLVQLVNALLDAGAFARIRLPD